MGRACLLVLSFPVVLSGQGSTLPSFSLVRIPQSLTHGRSLELRPKVKTHLRINSIEVN